MLTLIFVVSSIVQGLVTWHMYRLGQKNVSYLLFFWISITTWLWVLANYLSIMFISSSSLIYIVRLILALAIVQTALFYVFAHKFPASTWNKSDGKFVKYGLFALLALFMTISPLMFESVYVENSVNHTEIGSGILLFLAFIMFSLVGAFKVLIRRFHSLAGMQRAQVLFILFAAAINWIVIPLTNFVLTLLSQNMIFVMLSPIYGLLFSAIIAYALARHHLFDFKKALWDSDIYVDYYLRSRKGIALQYYQLQTLIDRSTSSHVALDFSGVDNLDKDAERVFKTLDHYIQKQDKKIYFIGYTNKVFKQLRRIIAL